MDPTVTGAMIGVAGTLLGFIVNQILELFKLRIEESKEVRRQQRTWLRDHNVDRYDRVKNWVIDAMKVVDPAPIVWRPDSDRMTQAEFMQLLPQDKYHHLNEVWEGINNSAAEVKVFASCDEQLAQCLQAFIYTLDGLGESREPDKIKEAHSAAAKVINRVYELMLQVPK